MDRRRRIVVLDDDPTGTQAAADVTVLFGHDEAILAEVLRENRSVYLQTNSRALPEPEAVALAQSIRTAVERASRRLGVDVRVVLRGDSTLRGHVFAESREFATGDSLLVFVPAFPDGGRRTRDGVHLVEAGGIATPVGRTEFARDPVFGFTSSNLVDFTAERTGTPATSVSLDSVRSGAFGGILRAAPAGAVLVVDAVATDDIRVIARTIEAAWEHRDVVVRSAAPLAAELAGVASDGPLDPGVLAGRKSALVVCGSHTDGARAQVARVAALIGAPTEIGTAGALDDGEAEGRRAATAEERIDRPGGVRFITTERERSTSHARLDDGAAVMRALSAAAGHLAHRADVVVTKGGITAAEVIRSSLGSRRAVVLGQIAPGVSVWDALAADGRTIRCVIVPGNMGDEALLADLVRRVIGDGV